MFMRTRYCNNSLFIFLFIYSFFFTFNFSVTAKRPPVEETATFLQSLLASHGPNYLEKLFGNKARDTLKPLGGVEKVAIALSGKFSQLNKILS